MPIPSQQDVINTLEAFSQSSNELIAGDAWVVLDIFNDLSELSAPEEQFLIDESAADLHSFLQELINEEHASFDNERLNGYTFREIIYFSLVRLGMLSPINDRDPNTQQPLDATTLRPINEEDLFVLTSTRQQYDVQSLIEHYTNYPALRYCDPITNERFSDENDIARLEKIIQRRRQPGLRELLEAHRQEYFARQFVSNVLMSSLEMLHTCQFTFALALNIVNYLQHPEDPHRSLRLHIPPSREVGAFLHALGYRAREQVQAAGGRVVRNNRNQNNPSGGTSDEQTGNNHRFLPPQ